MNNPYNRIYATFGNRELDMIQGLPVEDRLLLRDVPPDKIVVKWNGDQEDAMVLSGRTILPTMGRCVENNNPAKTNYMLPWYPYRIIPVQLITGSRSYTWAWQPTAMNRRHKELQTSMFPLIPSHVLSDGDTILRVPGGGYALLARRSIWHVKQAQRYLEEWLASADIVKYIRREHTATQRGERSVPEAHELCPMVHEYARYKHNNTREGWQRTARVLLTAWKEMPLGAAYLEEATCETSLLWKEMRPGMVVATAKHLTERLRKAVL